MRRIVAAPLHQTAPDASVRPRGVVGDAFAGQESLKRSFGAAIPVTRRRHGSNVIEGYAPIVVGEGDARDRHFAQHVAFARVLLHRSGVHMIPPSPTLRAALEAAAPGDVRAGVSLAALGRWRIGGPADLVVDPGAVDRAQAVIRLLIDSGVRWTVIGEGSNLLFDSAGYRGVVLRIGPRLSRFHGDPETGVVEAEAGLWTPYFVLKTIRLGLTGCVHAIGIPGMIGGLVVMNGGSQRQGIGDRLLDVTAIDRTGALTVTPREACGFAYRRSAFQESGAVIVSARFGYEPGDVSALRREAIGIMQSRKRKFPKNLPNCGSVFVSDPALYATLGPPGAAIEAVGLKGARCGGARISPLHANFIVNEGGARSEDVLALIALARRRVHERTGIAMRSEVLHLRPDGVLRPAHESAPTLE